MSIKKIYLKPDGKQDGKPLVEIMNHKRDEKFHGFFYQTV